MTSPTAAPDQGAPSGAPVPPDDPTAVLGRRAAAAIADSLISNLVVLAVVLAAQITLWERVPAGSVEGAFDTCNAFNQQADPDSLGSTICYPFGSTAFLVDLPALFRLLLLINVLGLLWLLINGVLIPTFTGGSIGKLLAGVRVVRPDGTNPGLWRHAGRAAALLFEGGLIAIILVFVTKGHRRAGDYLSDTYVVAVASTGAPVLVPGDGPPPMPPPGTPLWDPALDTYVTFRPDLGGWLVWDPHGSEWKAMHP